MLDLCHFHTAATLGNENSEQEHVGKEKPLVLAEVLLITFYRGMFWLSNKKELSFRTRSQAPRLYNPFHAQLN